MKMMQEKESLAIIQVNASSTPSTDGNRAWLCPPSSTNTEDVTVDDGASENSPFIGKIVADE